MSTDRINGKTSIAEAINICPDAADVFEKHGMGCYACMAASSETIEEGALMHGVDVQAILAELNARCEEADKP
jgi:hybrid cluster-associated redox disulfide protein